MPGFANGYRRVIACWDWVKGLILARLGRCIDDSWGMDAWAELVISMNDAIEDRSHVVYLGYAASVVLLVWVHWRVAKFVLRQFERAQADN